MYLNRYARRKNAAIARKLSSKMISAITVGALGFGVNISLPHVAHAGPDACTVVGTVATCTGNQSDGITNQGGTPDFTTPPVVTLNVNNLLAPGITPAAGVSGINFQPAVAQDIIINVDTTSTGGILVNGANADGILGRINGDGNVIIVNTGDVATTGDNGEGISGFVNNDGDVTITNVGNINTADSDGLGIASRIFGDGNSIINNTGNITTNGRSAEAIFSTIRGSGNITITSIGDLSTGDIASGIDASISLDGNILITSSGNITTTGAGAEGIDANTNNGNVTIVNTGNVKTDDIGSEGIFGQTQTGNVLITSMGNFSTFSDGIEGQVDVDGTVTIISIGNIDTTGDRGRGIRGLAEMDGDITITSVGSINTLGVFAAGIEAEVRDDGNITITNNGDITSAMAAGIQTDVDGTGSIVITHNSGTVSGTTGILVNERTMNAPTTIDNSGIITGTMGTAINLQGDGNDTVNLLRGSVINGAIDFGNGNDGAGGTNPNDIDTLNVEVGQNLVVNFADAGGAGQGDTDLQSAPENINAGGAFALVNGGTTLVVVDPTSFAASSVFISDLSNTLHNTLDQNLTTVNAQGSTSGPGDEDLSEAFFATRFWIAGFAGDSETSGVVSQGITDIDSDFTGFTSGVETGAYSDGIWGVFGGTSNSNLDLQFGQGALDVDSVFGGLYYKRDYGDFRINAAFAFGNADHDSTRNTLGAASSTADFDGFFYSPSLTLEAPIDLFPFNPGASISGRINYTNLELDGYTETGGPAPLTVAGRDISLFGARAQLNLPNSHISDEGILTQLDVSLGVDGQFIDSDNVNSTINLGGPTAFNFAADIDDRVSGFVGAGLSFTSADGASTISFSGEFQSDFDNQDDRATGEIRATFRF